MKLSHREKVLVWILLNGVLCLGLFKLNAFSKGTVLYQIEEEANQTQIKQQEMYELLAQSTSIKENYTNLREVLHDYEEQFFRQIEVEVLEEWISREQEKYHLTTIQLELEEPIPYEVFTEETLWTVLYEYPVMLQLEGEKKDVVSFMDHLVHSGKMIRVDRLDFNEKGGTLGITCYSISDALSLQDETEDA